VIAFTTRVVLLPAVIAGAPASRDELRKTRTVAPSPSNNGLGRFGLDGIIAATKDGSLILSSRRKTDKSSCVAVVVETSQSTSKKTRRRRHRPRSLRAGFSSASKRAYIFDRRLLLWCAAGVAGLAAVRYHYFRTTNTRTIIVWSISNIHLRLIDSIL
jgi:hypothetical protein